MLPGISYVQVAFQQNQSKSDFTLGFPSWTNQNTLIEGYIWVSSLNATEGELFTSL